MAVYAGGTPALVLGSALISVLTLVGLRPDPKPAPDVLRPWPHVARLPAPLAGTELLDAEHPGRGRCGVVWHRPTGLMSATVLLAPSAGLVRDSAVAETYAACWWKLLDAACARSEIRAATVTVDVTVVAGGGHGESAAGVPSPVWLTLTVDPTATWRPVSSVADATALTVRTLDRLDVGAAGLVVLRPASAADLARIVRAALEPAGGGFAVDAEPPAWGELAPRTEAELAGVYRHERWHSVSWALHVPPGRRPDADVLPRLLRPDALRRRVTLARWQTPRETGSAVFVTVSVGDPGSLGAARARIEGPAGSSTPVLCSGQQADAFAAGLPVGWFPPRPLGGGGR